MTSSPHSGHVNRERALPAALGKQPLDAYHDGRDGRLGDLAAVVEQARLHAAALRPVILLVARVVARDLELRVRLECVDELRCQVLEPPRAFGSRRRERHRILILNLRSGHQSDRLTRGDYGCY